MLDAVYSSLVAWLNTHSWMRFSDVTTMLNWRRCELPIYICNYCWRFNFIIFTQVNSIYILKSTLTPQPKRKDRNDLKEVEQRNSGSSTPNLSPNWTPSSTPPAVANRKNRKSISHKSLEKDLQNKTVHVCCHLLHQWFIWAWRHFNIKYIISIFDIFQYSKHERIPSITTTEYIDELVKNGCIDVEQSSNACGNKNSSDPKQGWTKMSSQVR